MDPNSNPLPRPAPRLARDRLLDPLNLVVFPSLLGLVLARHAGVIAAEPLWKLCGALVVAHFVSTIFAARYTPGTDRAKPALFLALTIALGGVVIYLTGWGAILAVAFVAHSVVVIHADGSRYGFAATLATMLTIVCGEVAVALGLVHSMIPEPTGHGIAIIEASITAIVIALVTRGQREKEIAEAHERAGEERFRALVQHASDAILVIDDTGGVMYASPAAGHLFGCDVERARTLRSHLGRSRPRATRSSISSSGSGPTPARCSRPTSRSVGSTARRVGSRCGSRTFSPTRRSRATFATCATSGGAASNTNSSCTTRSTIPSPMSPTGGSSSSSSTT